MLVAVFIMVVLLWIVVRVFINLREFKARSERRAELSATARALSQMLRRDLAGCYIHSSAGDGFTLVSTSGHHELTLWTATANPGESEVAKVIYKIEGSALRRIVNAYKFNGDSGSPVTHSDADFDVAREVESFELSPNPSVGWPKTVRLVVRFSGRVKLGRATGETVVFSDTLSLPVEGAP
jgi:type II secretory pathway component PulJ